MFRNALFAVTLLLPTSMLACAAEEGAASDDGYEIVAGPDIAKGDELLAKAAKMAESPELGTCAVPELAIIATLREAVKVRDSKPFRDKIANNEALSKALSQNLAFKEIVGTLTITPEKTTGLADALSEGVTMWRAENGSSPAMKLEFKAGGELSVSVLEKSQGTSAWKLKESGRWSALQPGFPVPSNVGQFVTLPVGAGTVGRFEPAPDSADLRMVTLNDQDVGFRSSPIPDCRD